MSPQGLPPAWTAVTDLPVFVLSLHSFQLRGRTSTDVLLVMMLWVLW